MTAHTFTHARHLYRGKDRLEGASPGTDRDAGTRGIRAYIPTKYVIANGSGSAIPASANAAFATEGSGTAVAITTTTMTGNTANAAGHYPFARSVRVFTSGSFDETAIATVVGLDMYGATIQSNMTMASASGVSSDKGFAVILSGSNDAGSATVKWGHGRNYGLPYHLANANDGIVVNNIASGAAGTASTIVVHRFVAGVAATGTVTNSGGDPRGLVELPVDVADGSGIPTVWYHVDNTDIAYGPGRGNGGGGNA